MKLEEAIAALRGGKKIKHATWVDEYYYLIGGRLFNKSSENTWVGITFPEYLDGWEIVRDKKTYKAQVFKDDRNEVHIVMARMQVIPSVWEHVKTIEFELEE